MKLMRAEGIRTLEEANAYLDNHYLPEWQLLFTKRPASADDAHRPVGKQHGLEAILCRVERRVVANDYTFRVGAQMYQSEREHVRPRLGGASIRVEQRRNGEIAVRLEGKYLRSRQAQHRERPTLYSELATATSDDRYQLTTDGF